MLFFRLFAAIRHYLRSLSSKKGYGIHSPFAFSFITDILSPESTSAFYCFDSIEKLRYKNYQRQDSFIRKDGRKVILGREIRKSATPAKDGQILFRTALFQQSRNILELGTSLGFGTAYLAAHHSKARVISIDHDAKVQSFAKNNLEELGIVNVKLLNASFDDELEKQLNLLGTVDLIFFDGNHKREATLRYFNTSLPFITNKSIFIFHDIHWSHDMYQAWQEIYNNDKVSASFELMNMGLVFFDPELNKEHFYA